MSFKGRIRRLEYGISVFIFAVSVKFIQVIGHEFSIGSPSTESLFLLLQLPFWWFNFAQGAKRSHDIGNSGWWQLLPFYGIGLLFFPSEIGINQYGANPKGVYIENPIKVEPKGYEGNYDGGHNKTSPQIDQRDRNQNSGEYPNGGLYN